MQESTSGSRRHNENHVHTLTTTVSVTHITNDDQFVDWCLEDTYKMIQLTQQEEV